MIDKIRKLLALASNNPSEEEAAVALSKAQALMLEHGIQEHDLKPETKPTLTQGGHAKTSPWQRVINSAAATLTGTASFWNSGTKQSSFFGRPENVEAARLLADWLEQQVDAIYKVNLPKGLTTSERSKFRSSFKYGCAVRIHQRAQELQERLTRAQSQFALVLVDEVKAHTDTLRKARPMRGSQSDRNAVAQGLVSGNAIKLRKDME